MAKQQSQLLAADELEGALQSGAPAGAEPAPETAKAFSTGPGHDYVVVARRYRPQAFDELVGQEHVARALSNAIATNRVGHAYLFTGARGVGKTSAARILAKALQCVKGPTATPCDECDICQGIVAGSDVDVLEIDGASNRGIDEIRQLRQNVGVRPSRARFKIYIIDEVHMLTREAFNALLKTLEEPPEHVKFIFCTTEANKIPITILSRCQRFDFAGIRAPSIRERLAQIAAAEGVEAEPAALDLLARRANGSMRDSQSLLEQLLSFGGQTIRAADVNALLGTAGEARLAQTLQRLVDHDARGALEDLDVAVFEGVEVGQLLEQLLGVFRDAMAAAVGCPPDAFLYTSSEGQQGVANAGKALGLNTILAVMQILDHTLARMRYSTQGRTLAETALVRICSLENLDAIATIIERLEDGAASREPGAQREPNAPSRVAPTRPAGLSAAGGPPRAVDAGRVETADSGGKKKAGLTAERGEAVRPTGPISEPAVEGGRREPALREHEAQRRADRDPAQAIQAANEAFDRLSVETSGGGPELFEPGELAEAAPRGALDAKRAAKAGTASPAETAVEGGRREPALREVGSPLAADHGAQAAGPIAWESAIRQPGQFWTNMLARLEDGFLQDSAGFASRVAISAPNRLVVYFPQRYNLQKSLCEQPDRLAVLVRVCEEMTGVRPRIDFQVDTDAADKAEPATRAAAPAAVARQRMVEKSSHPLVDCVAQTFGGVVVRVDPPAEKASG